MVKKVVHNGRDIKNAYSDAGKTLFSTMRETMNTERSQSNVNSPMKTLGPEAEEEEKEQSGMKGMVTKVERETDDGKT